MELIDKIDEINERACRDFRLIGLLTIIIIAVWSAFSLMIDCGVISEGENPPAHFVLLILLLVMISLLSIIIRLDQEIRIRRAWCRAMAKELDMVVGDLYGNNQENETDR